MSWLTDPLLDHAAARHGFGTRADAAPPGVLLPRQVHGTAVTTPGALREGPQEADAVVSTEPGTPVGVVTADCVPVLAAAPGGAVAAIHAGWRGLADGVLAVGIEALAAAAAAAAAPADLRAALGPHIGPCCYEVDDPVLDALARGHGARLDAALRPARPGHALLDLGALAAAALHDAGLRADAIGRAAVRCTACDPMRLASYRRDGPRAGRLVHYAVARGEG